MRKAITTLALVSVTLVTVLAGTAQAATCASHLGQGGWWCFHNYTSVNEAVNNSHGEMVLVEAGAPYNEAVSVPPGVTVLGVPETVQAEGVWKIGGGASVERVHLATCPELPGAEPRKVEFVASPLAAGCEANLGPQMWEAGIKLYGEYVPNWQIEPSFPDVDGGYREL